MRKLLLAAVLMAASAGASADMVLSGKFQVIGNVVAYGNTLMVGTERCNIQYPSTNDIDNRGVPYVAIIGLCGNHAWILKQEVETRKTYMAKTDRNGKVISPVYNATQFSATQAGQQ